MVGSHVSITKQIFLDQILYFLSIKRAYYTLGNTQGRPRPGPRAKTMWLSVIRKPKMFQVLFLQKFCQDCFSEPLPLHDTSLVVLKRKSRKPLRDLPFGIFIGIILTCREGNNKSEKIHESSSFWHRVYFFWVAAELILTPICKINEKLWY